MDINKLRLELDKNTDLNVLVQKGCDQDIADYFNEVDVSVQIPVSVPRGTFLLIIAGINLRLPTMQSNIQSKWDRVLATLRAVDSVDVQSPAVQALIQAALADAVVVQDEVTAINAAAVRPGTRAEGLFGPNSFVTIENVAKAMNRG